MSDSLSEPAALASRADAAAPWWKGAVIYQIYPRSFRDSNADGVGDLPGVLAGLDHVASVGVDAIWISPFFTSPMRDYGYDVADYCGVDPVFGTLEDFDRVVAKAHLLGLKVIVDQVYSHTSDEHAWFRESRSDRTNPKADWYVWADAREDGSPPSNWLSVFGGPAWTWDTRRKQYYLHNFLSSQPDLNLHNRQVQDAVLAAGRFWLERGVDGFRLDAINFAKHDPRLRDNPPSGLPADRVTRPYEMQRHERNQSHPDIPLFLSRVRALTDEFGAAFAVAEIGGPDADAEMKAFTEGDQRMHSAYSFDFLYADALTPQGVRASIERWSGAPGEGWPSWAFSNHDAPRAVTRWAPAGMRDQAARLYLLVLLSLRGNAFLYQGEELGLPQADVPRERLQDPEAIANWPHTLGRDGARTPMPWCCDAPFAGFSDAGAWLPVDPDHARLAVDAQTNDPDSTLAFTRRALSARAGSRALRLGGVRVLEAGESVLALERVHEGESVVCVYNLAQTPAVWAPVERGALTRIIDVGIDAEPGGDEAPASLPPLSGYWARPGA